MNETRQRAIMAISGEGRQVRKRDRSVRTSEKKEAILELLRDPAYSRASVNAVARRARTSWSFANQVLAEVRGDAPSREGVDGKLYPAARKLNEILQAVGTLDSDDTYKVFVRASDRLNELREMAT